MSRRLVILFFVLSSIPFAWGVTEVFFPPELVGGKVSLWSSGTIIFKGNGWAKGEPGERTTHLQWVDSKNDLRVVMCTWNYEIPEGRFLLGAERKDEKIIFTLTREGETQAFLKSKPFEIETIKHVDVTSRNEANQLPDPTSPSVTRPAGAGRAPSVAADH
jgi:hypothetical protein